MNYSVFCDASFCEKTKVGCIGVIVLSDDGKISKHKTSVNCPSSFFGEIEAIYFGLHRIPKHSNVTVFCDCLGVIDLINNEKANKKYKRINDIKKKLKDFNMINVDWLSDNKHNLIRECHIIANKKRKSLTK